MPANLPSVFGITIQWFIHDAINGAPQLGVFSNNDDEEVYLQLNPDGTLSILVGPIAGESRYDGTWTPGPGTPKKVVIVISDVGVPSVFVDDVPSPLVFNSLALGGGFQGNSVFLLLAANNNAPASFSTQKIFIASGSKAFQTYCCP